MLPRLYIAALIFPMLQAALFGLGVAADDWIDWSGAVADPIGQAAAAALLLGLPLAWGLAPRFLSPPDDRFERRLRRLERGRPRPAQAHASRVPSGQGRPPAWESRGADQDRDSTWP